MRSHCWIESVPIGPSTGLILRWSQLVRGLRRILVPADAPAPHADKRRPAPQHRDWLNATRGARLDARAPTPPTRIPGTMETS